MLLLPLRNPLLQVMIIRTVRADPRIPGIVVVGTAIPSVVPAGRALICAGGGARVAVTEKADAVVDPADDAAGGRLRAGVGGC